MAVKEPTLKNTMFLPYFGGKYLLSKWVIDQFPKKFDRYVEVFGGSAAILLKKEPSKVEVYNDIDSNIVNFWRVLQDPIKAEKLRRLLKFTPYSREEWKLAFAKSDDDVINAQRLLIRAHLSFSSRSVFGINGGFQRSEPRTNSFGVIADGLVPLVCKRLKKVVLENTSFEDILSYYDKDTTFFYVDPPYFSEERTCKTSKYANEVNEAGHHNLVEMLLDAKAYVAISGYRNKLYKKFDKYDWNVYSKKAYTQSVKNNNHHRTEVLWTNY
jgi:DNA adenine methylase